MTTEVNVSSMSDEELSQHLAELHTRKDELLGQITAASDEVAQRAAALSDAGVVASLPASVRDQLGGGQVPEHIKNALVEAQAAQANGAGTDAEAEQAKEETA